MDFNYNSEMESHWWEKAKAPAKEEEEEVKSQSFWSDGRERLFKNKPAVLGLLVIIFMILFAIIGPFFSPYTMNGQNLPMANVGIVLHPYTLENGTLVSMQPGMRLYEIAPDGHVLGALDPVKTDMINKNKVFDVNGEEVLLDFSQGTIVLEDSQGNMLESSGWVFNKTNRLGTDQLGRDMLVRLMYGARISLMIAFVSTFLNVTIGVIYGGIAGFYGGRIDNIMIRFVDIISTIPMMLYIILLMVILGPGIKTIIIAMAMVGWTGMVRQVRGQVLSLKSREYVSAARIMGVKDIRIILRHLIPNAMGTIIITAVFMVPDAIFTEAFLSFIGLGIPAPNASWGSICENGVQGFRVFPYQLICPAACITLTILAFNLLGDGLRDSFDPRLRK